jgi:hypothetical protein
LPFRPPEGIIYYIGRCMIAPPNRKDKVPLGLDGKHQQQRHKE